MKIDKVYFDMDGVLADFDRGVLTLGKMEPVPQNAPRPEGYDDRLWAHVRTVPHFYDRLEPVEGALAMFEEAYGLFGARCEILTGIPKPHRGIDTAAEDKREWVRRLLSPDVTVHTVLREEKKKYCTGAGSVLVDDLEKNIREWREAGGTGILFTDAAQTMQALRQLKAGGE